MIVVAMVQARWCRCRCVGASVRNSSGRRTLLLLLLLLTTQPASPSKRAFLYSNALCVQLFLTEAYDHAPERGMVALCVWLIAREAPHASWHPWSVRRGGCCPSDTVALDDVGRVPDNGPFIISSS